MPTAVRRAAWAEWAGWTCKEPEGSLRSGVQTLTNKNPRRETGGGFSFVPLEARVEEGRLTRG